MNLIVGRRADPDRTISDKDPVPAAEPTPALRRTPLATHGWRSGMRWAAAAALAAPVTVLLHEIGHFLAGLAMGFPDLVLHYGSVSDTAAESGMPQWQLGIQSAAGPIVTILLALVCCVYVARRGPDRWAIATGIVAPIRFLIGVVYIGYALLVWWRGGRMEGSNFDEHNVAVASGLPLMLILAMEIVFLLSVWVYLFRAIRGVDWRVALASIGVGAVAGLLMWITVLGPLVLP